MKLVTKEFKEDCKTILAALDNRESSVINETLELKSDGSDLLMNVTNREYYVRDRFNTGQEEKIHAAVKAGTFLKLIDKITTDNLEITSDGTILTIKGNGTYKLPIVYNNGSMVELQEIPVVNQCISNKISSNTLHSIITNNSRELTRGKINREIQRYYYLDNHGCITFVSGACVNNFETGEKDFSILLSDKVVKLFKLFKKDTDVNLIIGDNGAEEGKITISKFESGNISITTKSPNVNIGEVRVSDIRGMAESKLPYKVVLDKVKLKELLLRFNILTGDRNYGNFEFDKDHFVIHDLDNNNKESITATPTEEVSDKYSFIVNLNNLSNVLDGCEGDNLTMSFGNNRSILVNKGNVTDMLPESRVR